MTQISYMLLFSSPTCAPCKILKDKLKTYEQGKMDLRIEHVDVSEQFELSQHYMVRTVPTIICFDDNDQMVSRHDGCSIETAKKLLTIDPE